MTRSRLLAVLAFVLYIGNAFTAASAKDNAIVVSSPQDGATNISVLTTVSIVLNAGLETAALTPKNVSLYRLDGDLKAEIKGRIGFDSATNSLEFKPDRPLSHGKRYQFSVSGLASNDGPLEFSIYFSTYRNPLIRRVYYQQGKAAHFNTLHYDNTGRLDHLIMGEDILDNTHWQSITKYQYDTLGRESRVVTYSESGTDGTWQSVDDKIDFYQASFYDPQGNFVSNISAYGSGRDQQWFTRDDASRNYFVYAYDRDKRLISETMYLDSGKDGITFSADDTPSHHEKFIYDSNGVMTQSLRYNSPGKDQRWFSDDDGLQYYTKSFAPVEGKESGRIVYTQGGDGRWFNEDDAIQSYRLSRYGQNSVSYIYGTGAGNDGTWFNNDDNISHYTTYHSNAAGNPLRFTKHNGAGGDGLWFTRDDTVEFYTSHRYSDQGVALAQIQYSGPGADGVWLSADDQVASYESYSIDVNGNRREEKRYKGPGADGVWSNQDDELDYIFFYDANL